MVQVAPVPEKTEVMEIRVETEADLSLCSTVRTVEGPTSLLRRRFLGVAATAVAAEATEPVAEPVTAAGQGLEPRHLRSGHLSHPVSEETRILGLVHHQQSQREVTLEAMTAQP